MLLKNCRLVDVIGGRVEKGSWLRLKDGLIAAVGDSSQPPPPVPEQEKTIDLGDRFVIPGLIDAHVHLCVLQAENENETFRDNLRASENLKVLAGANHAGETLKSGFTTVRDMGQGDNLALREGVRLGLIRGPRIVACGWLGPTAGHNERMMAEWAGGVSSRPADRGADGPWAVRKKVRRLIGQGVDAIKTFASGQGFIEHPFDEYWSEGPNYTPEELSALVDEAHAAGRKVAAHTLVSAQGIKNALAAGVDTLEHGVILDEQAVELMAAQGTVYVPTGAVVDRMWNVSGPDKLKYLRVDIRKAAGYVEAHLRSVEMCRRAGVPIAMGSDTFRVLPHGGNAVELEWLVRAGLSALEALRAATYTAALALGLADQTGSLEPGKWADLVVLRGDPLKDISLLRDRQNIEAVFKDGMPVVGEEFVRGGERLDGHE